VDLQLLPRPPKPGLYSVTGDQTLIPYALRALTHAFVPQHRIVWVDACNQFNAHWIAQSARMAHIDSRAALSAFKYARPFTAFQLETMVAEKLLSAVRQSRALLAVIADPISLYEEAEEQRYSIHKSFEHLTHALHALSRELAILLLITQPRPSLYGQRLLRLSDRTSAR
jgi:hypothetical protein